ncbi:hypothetical protein BX070DRAFT_218822 [Coemansia spiralis]|nr:hypothetical protein BX070DRAFT_218822 [Coemansia spiralis]
MFVATGLVVAAWLTAATGFVVAAARLVMVAAAGFTAPVAVSRTIRPHSQRSLVPVRVANDLCAAWLAADIAARAGAALVINLLDEMVSLDHSSWFAALVAVVVDVQVGVGHAIGAAWVARVLVGDGQRWRERHGGCVLWRTRRCGLLAAMALNSCRLCFWCIRALGIACCRDADNCNKYKKCV